MAARGTEGGRSVSMEMEIDDFLFCRDTSSVIGG